MSSRQRRPTPGSTRTAQGACQCFPTPLSSEPALSLKGGFRILILSQPQLHTCVLPFVTHKPFSQVPSEVLVHLLLLPVHRDLVLAKLSRGVYCSIYCRQHGKGDGKRTQTLGLPEPCSAGGCLCSRTAVSAAARRPLWERSPCSVQPDMRITGFYGFSSEIGRAHV